MPRLAALVVTAAAAIVGLGAPVVATVPPPAEPSTTLPGVAVAPTTPEAVQPPGTTAPVAERGGVGAVDAAKDEDEDWNVRRIATVVGITVVVLAVAGFVYGRVRSARRPVTSRELVRTASPDVEQAART